MEENKKINTQIVIMVVIVIILILSLLGILLYVVNENRSLVNNDSTTTTISTTTTTTTMPIVEDEKTIVENVIEEYLFLLKAEEKISDYQYDVSLLTEEDYCPGMEYVPDKIYASVSITYKRIDESFTMTGNDDNTNTGSEDVFEAGATYIISLIDNVYQIEDLYTGC